MNPARGRNPHQELTHDRETGGRVMGQVLVLAGPQARRALRPGRWTVGDGDVIDEILLARLERRCVAVTGQDSNRCRHDAVVGEQDGDRGHRRGTRRPERAAIVLRRLRAGRLRLRPCMAIMF